MGKILQVNYNYLWGLLLQMMLIFFFVLFHIFHILYNDHILLSIAFKIVNFIFKEKIQWDNDLYIVLILNEKTSHA